MSAAAGIALLTLIAQVESTSQTRVLLLNDCPAGLEGFLCPSTLLHEAMHRLQHCRQPELAA